MTIHRVARGAPQTLQTTQAPRRGLIAGVRRLLLGDRVKHARVSDHGAFMRGLGRAWAIPMTLVFSSGALITLGQKQIAVLVGQYQHHQPLDYVSLALLAITLPTLDFSAWYSINMVAGLTIYFGLAAYAFYRCVAWKGGIAEALVGF